MILGIDWWHWRALSTTSTTGCQFGLEPVIVKGKAYDSYDFKTHKPFGTSCAPQRFHVHLKSKSFMQWKNKFQWAEKHESRENPFILWLFGLADKTKSELVFAQRQYDNVFFLFSLRGNDLSFTILEEHYLKSTGVSTKHPQKGIRIKYL